jgi:ubiquitin-activating enzyme E1 C
LSVYQYVGNDSIYAFTFKHEKNPECPVCGGETVDLKVKKGTKVESFIEMLTENQRLWVSLLEFRARLRSSTRAPARQPNQKTIDIVR